MRSCPLALLRLRLPPALLFAARSPLPRPRATAPFPPRPCAPARGSAPLLRLPHQGSLSPRTHGGPCGSLTPPLPCSPEARNARGRGGCATGCATGGRAEVRPLGMWKALSPHPRCPYAPRPAWCWAEEAGRGRKRTAVGKGRPAQPPGPGSCFRNTPFPRGYPDPGPDVFLQAAWGTGLVAIWGVGHRVPVTVRQRG